MLFVKKSNGAVDSVNVTVFLSRADASEKLGLFCHANSYVR
jgi:hypothetical protein